MNHYRFICLICVTFVIVLSAEVVRAGDKVTYAFFPREWPPFEMVVDGLPVGMSVDLFKVLMPDGVEMAVEMIPAPRAALRVSGKPVFTRLEAKKWFETPIGYLWSDPVLTIETALYSSKGNPIEYQSPASLEGLKVGCIKNYFYPEVQPLFDRGKAERYDVNSDLLLLRMLKAGRVDVVIFDDVSAAWQIHGTKNMHPEDFYVSSKPLASADLRFVFNVDEGWEKRLPDLNEKIREKRLDGTIDGIMSRYK